MNAKKAKQCKWFDSESKCSDDRGNSNRRNKKIIVKCESLSKDQCEKEIHCKWFDSENECSGDRRNPYRN
jgi:hypothetical protein